MDLRTVAEQYEKDTDSIIHNAREWIRNFVHTDQQKNEVIAALIRRLEDERHQINQLKCDLAAEHKLRNSLQIEARRNEAILQKFKQKIDDGAFLVVLIDGDRVNFADVFIRNPVNGAPKAAQVLKQTVRTYIADKIPELDSDDVPILIRVYANLDGLAQSLRLSRVIEKDEDLKSFAEQLTKSRAEVDFVDIGRGRGNTNTKLRKVLSHYHSNLQCKKIFVACCHEHGYLLHLQEYSDKIDPNQKIVLVETTPANPQLRSLGFPITRFDSVFRSMPLKNIMKQEIGLPLSAASDLGMRRATGVIIREQSLFQEVCRSPAQLVPQPQQQHMVLSPTTPVNGNNQPSLALPQAEIEAVSRNPSFVKFRDDRNIISHAIAKSRDNEVRNIKTKSFKARKQAKPIIYNIEGCRIDPPIQHPANTPARQSYQTKLQNIAPNTFCNDHYLVGACHRSICERVHDMDLTPQEISIHRYKARTSICPRGPRCRDPVCYLGHHCVKDPRCVRGSACKFFSTNYGNIHLDSSDKLQPAYAIFPADYCIA